MQNKIIDARDQACPKPLILTRQALKEKTNDEQLIILINNETSKDNVARFLNDNGILHTIANQNGIFTFTIGSAPTVLVHEDAAAYCKPDVLQKANKVLLIKSDKLGSAPDELGSILMKAFVNTIKEVQPLPSSIIFYTSGVLLAAEESPVIETLIELEKTGIAIFVCGTCADYFQIKNRIKVGTVSNMYTILELLTRADSVISP